MQHMALTWVTQVNMNITVTYWNTWTLTKNVCILLNIFFLYSSKKRNWGESCGCHRDNAGKHKSRVLGHPGDCILEGGAQYFWVFSTALHFTLLTPKILKRLLDCWKICAPLVVACLSSKLVIFFYLGKLLTDELYIRVIVHRNRLIFK